jgi:hypothetical protein
MKNSILYTILALVLIVAGSAYYFYTPPHKSILGRALVLVFVNNSASQANLANQWEKLDLSIDLIDACSGKNSAKRIACTRKYIQSALSRTKEVNKPLLLLSDKDSSQSLLAAMSKYDADQIAALILLQAKADENIP